MSRAQWSTLLNVESLEARHTEPSETGNVSHHYVTDWRFNLIAIIYARPRAMAPLLETSHAIPANSPFASFADLAVDKFIGIAARLRDAGETILSICDLLFGFVGWAVRISTEGTGLALCDVRLHSGDRHLGCGNSCRVPTYVAGIGHRL